MSKAERTKQHIIEQAAPLFNQKGIAGTTIDDVLQAAGVAKGCLYNHFESKEDLSQQATDFLLDKIVCRIEQAVSQGTSAKERIFAFLDFSKDPLATPITGGCPIFNLAVEADDNNPIVKQKVGARLLAGQAMFSAILQEGITSGEFAPTLNAQEFAFKMVAAIEGAIVICRILNTSQPMQPLIKGFKAELEAHLTK